MLQAIENDAVINLNFRLIALFFRVAQMFNKTPTELYTLHKLPHYTA